MKPAPTSADRIIDAAALIMVLGGIGDGTRAMPQGISAVTVADFHVAQSRMGLWIVGVGVLVGCAAAIRHRLRRPD